MTKAKIGVVFPAREIGTDPAAVREWAQGVEQLGFAHIAVPDHVVGVDPSRRTDAWAAQWPHPTEHVRVPYTHLSEFHEPMVLFGFLAALTRLELVTGILVLPQRQTVLVAKQVAELALLSAGGLRLGVGTGWNPAEFEALGMPFQVRGRLVDEQVPLLRRLWSEPVLDVDGEFHKLEGVGIAPRPTEPIPVWMGGGTAFARGIDALRRPLTRIGRLADGWYLDSAAKPGPALRKAYDVIEDARAAAGRVPGPMPVDGRILLATAGGDDGIRQLLDDWHDVPVSHITVDSMGIGCTSPQEHLHALDRVMRLL